LEEFIMNAVKSIRISKFLVTVMLLVTLILPTEMLTNVAQAATKPSIETKMTIGTGSIVGAYDYYSKSNNYVLGVSDTVKNATYSFTSSNTKVVTAKVSGSNAILTGIKAGTATITCNQKLNGKTTKVGTCKVTVLNSSLYSQDFIPELPLGTSAAREPVEFGNRNNDAIYTYTSDSGNFTMKESLKEFDDMYFISHTFTAKAPGTYTVTVKETYNKSTRTVGKLKYTVKKATVEKESTIDLGDDILGLELISNYRQDVNYFYSGDNENVEGYLQNDSVYLKAKSVGTTTIKIYEDATKADDSKLIGTCKITVKEVVLESLDYEFDETETNVGGDAIGLEVNKTPDNAPGTITVTSSNPSVATVSKLDEEGSCTITPVSAGTTTITITCGNITKTQIITVNEDEE
jgi:hypothetical protein